MTGKPKTIEPMKAPDPLAPVDVEGAYRMLNGAAQMREYAKDLAARDDQVGARCEMADAEMMEKSATAALALAEADTKVGNGNELILADPRKTGGLSLVDTVADSKSQVTLSASRQRLELLAAADAAALGIDLAETIGARNSIERAIVHQMAAAHKLAMQTMAKAQDWVNKSSPTWGVSQGSAQQASVETARLVNASARLMGAFGEAAATIQRLRTGGKQRVTVKHIHQHVQVKDGGNAVIAGSMKGGRGRGKRRGSD